MNNFDLSDKLALELLLESGAHVSMVAYNPNIVVGDPEADAIAAGWTQHYREVSANLIEVIYTINGIVLQQSGNMSDLNVVSSTPTTYSSNGPVTIADGGTVSVLPNKTWIIL